MTKNNNNFDERQQLERGKAFQWSFITAVLLLAIYYLFEDGLEICKFSTSFIFMTTFWIAFAVFSTIAVLCDAFNGINSKNSPIFGIIYGVVGLFILTVIVIEMLRNQSVMTNNTILSDDIAYIITGLSMLEIGAVFLIKYIKNKRNISEEE